MKPMKPGGLYEVVGGAVFYMHPLDTVSCWLGSGSFFVLLDDKPVKNVYREEMFPALIKNKLCYIVVLNLDCRVYEWS